MTFKICGRRGGKSFEAVRRLLANPNAVLIVPDTMQRELVYSHELRSRIYTREEVRDGALRGKGATTIIIENLDQMLYGLFNLSGVQEIDLITATGVADVSPNPFIGDYE